MKKCGPTDEPLCETSEKGEHLFSRNELLPAALDIGRRILEIFGYQEISKIIFRLKSNSREINEVINGEALPSAELLLGIQKTTGASIDWILTGKGSKFRDQPRSVIHLPAAARRWTIDDDQPPMISAEMH